jgi:hypothetical protein
MQRWNFEQDTDGKVLVCEGEHERSEACNYRPITVDDCNALKKAISAPTIVESHGKIPKHEFVPSNNLSWSRYCEVCDYSKTNYIHHFEPKNVDQAL